MELFLILFIVLFTGGVESFLRLQPDVKEVTKALNTSVMLACMVVDEEGDDEDEDEGEIGELSWLDLQGNKITSSGRLFTEDEDTRTKKLYIQSIKQEDTGVYTCRHDNHHNHHNHHPPVSVKLSLFREISFEAPPIQRLNQSEDGLVRCLVMGTPTPTVSWTFNNNKIHSADKYELLEEGLLIRGVVRGDRGVYHCRAEVMSDARFDKKKISVLINYQPEWLIPYQSKSIFSNEGVVNITCSAKSEPPPSFDWFLSSNSSSNENEDGWRKISNDVEFRILKKSKFVSIMQVLHNHQHIISCRVSNCYGSINTTFHLNPTQNISVELLSTTTTTLTLSWVSQARHFSIKYRKIEEDSENMTWKAVSDWFVNEVTPPTVTNQASTEDISNNVKEVTKSRSRHVTYNITNLQPSSSYEVVVIATNSSFFHPSTPLFLSTPPLNPFIRDSEGKTVVHLTDSIVSSLGGQNKTIIIIIMTIIIIIIIISISYLLFNSCVRKRGKGDRMETECLKVHLENDDECVKVHLENDDDCLKVNGSGDCCVKVNGGGDNDVLKVNRINNKEFLKVNDDSKFLKVKPDSSAVLSNGLTGENKKNKIDKHLKNNNNNNNNDNNDNNNNDNNNNIKQETEIHLPQNHASKPPSSPTLPHKTTQTPSQQQTQHLSQQQILQQHLSQHPTPQQQHISPIKNPQQQPPSQQPPFTDQNIVNNNKKIDKSIVKTDCGGDGVGGDDVGRVGSVGRVGDDVGKIGDIIDEHPQQPPSSLLSSSCYLPRDDNPQQVAAKNRRSIMPLRDPMWNHVIQELHHQLGVAMKSDEEDKKEEDTDDDDDDVYIEPTWKHI